jgi:hypothetical protein
MMRSILDKANVGLAVLALIALAVKLSLTASAAEATRVVAERQHRIVAAQTLAQVDNQLVQMLASASAQTNDAAVRQLLSDNGINFTVNTPPPGAPPAQPAVPR